MDTIKEAEFAEIMRERFSRLKSAHNDKKNFPYLFDINVSDKDLVERHFANPYGRKTIDVFDHTYIEHTPTDTTIYFFFRNLNGDPRPLIEAIYRTKEDHTYHTDHKPVHGTVTKNIYVNRYFAEHLEDFERVFDLADEAYELMKLSVDSNSNDEPVVPDTVEHIYTCTNGNQYGYSYNINGELKFSEYLVHNYSIELSSLDPGTRRIVSEGLEHNKSLVKGNNKYFL